MSLFALEVFQSEELALTEGGLDKNIANSVDAVNGQEYS